ncbi:MAG: putative rane protein [Clostridiales bacterium]|jgi:electron transport complex protein RnfD|nr:putative rane protein [Clostridiales bacterium]
MKATKLEHMPKLNPHIKTPSTTSIIMQDVAIALIPALLGAFYFFGIRSLYLVAASVASCVISEFIWQKIVRRQSTIGDFSAVVTGILIAFNLPVTTPIWVAVVASMFAIIVVKQFFGGIGSNFANPALMGRIFIMVMWPTQVMQYVTTFHSGVDSVTSATVLSMLKGGQEITQFSTWDMFIGNIPGAIGETSALLLLIGFIYMCYRGIVNAKAAIIYIATVIAITFVFGGDGLFTGDIMTNLLGGGLILGAFYMLTDYAFVSARGKLMLAVLAGIITAGIRVWGGYPEGVAFGILAANCFIGFFERIKKTHVYGVKDKQNEGW